MTEPTPVRRAAITVNLHPHWLATYFVVASEGRVVLQLGTDPTIVNVFLSEPELYHLLGVLTEAHDNLTNAMTQLQAEPDATAGPMSEATRGGQQ